MSITGALGRSAFQYAQQSDVRQRTSLPVSKGAAELQLSEVRKARNPVNSISHREAGPGDGLDRCYQGGGKSSADPPSTGYISRAAEVAQHGFQHLAWERLNVCTWGAGVADQLARAGAEDAATEVSAGVSLYS